MSTGVMEWPVRGSLLSEPSAPQQAAPRDASISEPRTGAVRIDSFDAARLVAIIGIIYLHAVETSQLERFFYIGTFGVPFYLFAALYFQARSFRQHPTRRLDSYIFSRVRRLYVPFLVWTVIYLAARDAKHLFFTHEPIVPLRFWQIWTGSAHHLWFLPMLMSVTVITGLLSRLFIYNRIARRVVIALLAILGTILAIIPRPDWLNYVRGDEGYFIFQCWKILPSVALGVALAWTLAWEWDGRRLPPVTGLLGAALTIAMVSNQTINGYSRLDRTLSGMGWFGAAMVAWRGPWMSWAARLGRHGYGMYLTHILFIEGLQAVMHHAGFGASIGLDVSCIIVAITGSAATAVLLDRSRHLRWLTGE